MHSASTRYTGLNPGTALRLKSTNRQFRLGFLVRRKSEIFGVSVRHIFEPAGFDIILDSNGEKVSTFNIDNQFREDSARRLAIFSVRQRHLEPENLNFAGVWPRTAADPGRCLGARIWSTTDEFSSGGEVIEVDSVVRVSFSSERHEVVRGLLLAHFEDDSILQMGFAGTPFVNESGEAVGLALAGISRPTGAHILLSPIHDFLGESDFQLWAPPGAHWSDIDRKLQRFANIASSSMGPDLGPPPRVRHREI